MTQISLLIRIKATPEEVFEQIATSNGIAKWFTEASFSTNKNSGELNLQLWGDTNFEVTELSPSSLMIWHCTSEDNPWFGTDIKFELSSESGKTVVTFDHIGWPEISDLYRDCAMSWAYFLESLRSLIEKGVGTPEGVAPKCEASAT
jgi:uncharacterized protein YndB with AHSA1/START domain